MRRILRTTVVATLWAILFSCVPVGAARAAEATVAKPHEFAVWSGGCSRSLKCVETFATASAAAQKAAELRKQSSFVTVLNGTSNYGAAVHILYLHRGVKDVPKFESCVVMTPQCRVGWRALANEEPLNGQQAEALAAELRSKGGLAEVVYKFAAK